MDHEAALRALAEHYAPLIVPHVEDQVGIRLPAADLADLLVRERTILGSIVSWGVGDTPTRECYGDLVLAALGTSTREPDGAISRWTAEEAVLRGWIVSAVVM